MGFRIGRILIWWTLEFLVMYVLLQLPFAVLLIADYGTTFNDVLTTVMVAGLILISLADAVMSD